MKTRLLHKSDKHVMYIKKRGDYMFLEHHGVCLIITTIKDEKQVNILKNLYNGIVNNHNQIKINYKRKEA